MILQTPEQLKRTTKHSISISNIGTILSNLINSINVVAMNGKRRSFLYGFGLLLSFAIVLVWIERLNNKVSSCSDVVFTGKAVEASICVLFVYVASFCFAIWRERLDKNRLNVDNLYRFLQEIAVLQGFATVLVTLFLFPLALYYIYFAHCKHETLLIHFAGFWFVAIVMPVVTFVLGAQKDFPAVFVVKWTGMFALFMLLAEIPILPFYVAIVIITFICIVTTTTIVDLSFTLLHLYGDRIDNKVQVQKNVEFQGMLIHCATHDVPFFVLRSFWFVRAVTSTKTSATSSFTAVFNVLMGCVNIFSCLHVVYRLSSLSVSQRQKYHTSIIVTSFYVTCTSLVLITYCVFFST